MNPLPMILATAVLASTQAQASDWKGQPLAAKRQIASQVIDCMKRRMYSDRLVSYNDAAKTCRDQVQGQLEKATSGPLVAAAADTHSK